MLPLAVNGQSVKIPTPGKRADRSTADHLRPVHGDEVFTESNSSLGTIQVSIDPADSWHIGSDSRSDFKAHNGNILDRFCCGCKLRPCCASSKGIPCSRIRYPSSMSVEKAEVGDLESLQARFEVLQSRLNAAKIAYLNSAPFDGRLITYEDVKGIAEELIESNYALQRARYGRVRLKLSVAKLLRRGR